MIVNGFGFWVSRWQRAAGIQRLETDGDGGKISGFDLAAEKSHWQWGGLWCAAGFRQMGRMAGLVVAKRLIDIIRATDNSVLAGPRRSLAR